MENPFLDDTNPFLSSSEPASTSEPNVTKYLSFLGNAEGADYNTIVGGSKFEDYSKHPGIVGVTTAEGPSTAAGKYQITKTTYDQYAKKLGITDFSPESQDKIALELIKDKGALEDVQKGDYDSANKKLGGVWASLPSSPYSQPKRSEEWVNKQLGTESNPFLEDSANPFLQDTTETPPVEDKSIPVVKDSVKAFFDGEITAEEFRKQQELEDKLAAKVSKPEDTTNWLGTGPKETVGEYFSKGFAGRIAKGTAERLGLKDKVSDKSLSDLIVKEDEAPSPPVSESLYAMGKQIIEHPWEATKALVYEAGRDPELLVPGLWEAWPAKLGAMVKRLNTLSKAGVMATRAAATGAGLETAAQLAEGKYDPNAIVTTGAAFGIGGAIGEGISAGLGKGVEKIRATEKPKVELDVAGSVAKSQETAHQYDLFENQEMINHPSSVEAKVMDEHVGKTATEVVQDTINNIAKDTWESKVFRKEVEDLVPDENIRKRMTMALEADKEYDRLYTDKEMRQKLYGDEPEVRAKKESAAALQRQYNEPILKENQVDIGMIEAADRMKQKLENPNTKWKNEAEKIDYQQRLERLTYAIDKLKVLPSEEHAIPVLERVKERFNTIGKEALDRGMIEGMRNNYVTHVLDWSKSLLNRKQKLDLADYLFRTAKEPRFNRDFTESRIYSTIRELEKAIQGWADLQGIKNTGIVVEKDIAKLLQTYENSMRTAILHDKMIKHFENYMMEGTGLPGLIKVTEDNARNVIKANQNDYVKFKGIGSKAIGDYLVHPDLVDSLKFIFRENDPNVVQRFLGSVSHLSKSLNTIGSLFHAYSLSQAGATAAPGQFFKEAFKGFPGIRAAVEHFEKGTSKEQVEYALKSGVVLGTEDVQRTIVADVGKWADSMVDRFNDKDLKIVRQVTDPLDKQILQRMNRFTWDYMHTGQKLHMFNYFANEMKMKNPHLSDAVIGREVADFVNSTFGGLNWLQVASAVENKYMKAFAMKAAGIQGRDWAQILMFAPDWTVSTLRSFTNALPKETFKPWKWDIKEGAKGFVNPKTKGDLARRYVFNTMVAWSIILNAINYAMSGHYIWENEDPTRIDRGDGTSMQLAKHSMEAAEWLRDPQKTLGNKLGFWPKALVTMTTGKAYPSPSAPMIKDNTFIGRTIHSAKAALPFQVGSAMTAPPGEKIKRAAMSMLGVPIYGQTKSQFTSPEVLRERAKKRLESKIERIEKQKERRNK